MFSKVFFQACYIETFVVKSSLLAKILPENFIAKFFEKATDLVENSSSVASGRSTDGTVDRPEIMAVSPFGSISMDSTLFLAKQLSSHFNQPMK